MGIFQIYFCGGLDGCGNILRKVGAAGDITMNQPQ
jgi:hypothetical protein